MIVASCRSARNGHGIRILSSVVGYAVGPTRPMRLIVRTCIRRREIHRTEVRQFAIVADHVAIDLVQLERL